MSRQKNVTCAGFTHMVFDVSNITGGVLDIDSLSAPCGPQGR